MLTIFDWHTGPYPARVRIAVAELGLREAVRFSSVDLRKGEHKTPGFLAKNYSGTLPVIELEDGTLIAECTAITEYLDNLAGPPRLTGTTAREKGLIHMMTRRAELEFLDALSVYFHHATPGLGPLVEKYQNREWGLRMKEKALRGAGYFNGVLGDRAFVAGEFFSMADVAVIGGFIFADILKVDIPAEFEHLHAWHRRMLERASVKGWREMSEPVEAAT